MHVIGPVLSFYWHVLFLRVLQFSNIDYIGLHMIQMKKNNSINFILPLEKNKTDVAPKPLSLSSETIRA